MTQVNKYGAWMSSLIRLLAEIGFILVPILSQQWINRQKFKTKLQGLFIIKDKNIPIILHAKQILLFLSSARHKECIQDQISEHINKTPYSFRHGIASDTPFDTNIYKSKNKADLEIEGKILESNKNKALRKYHFPQRKSDIPQHVFTKWYWRSSAEQTIVITYFN
jgi:hypothetical protein